MGAPHEFPDTNSSMGQGPTEATSYWIGSPGSHSGEAAGGTENLRADASVKGIVPMKGAHPGAEGPGVSGVKTFNDSTV